MNELFDAKLFESLGTSPTYRIPSNGNPNAETRINNSYRIQELYLTIKSGAKISLIETMSSMVIYEDIFCNAVNGYIELNDIVGGLSKFYITGGESLTMKILKPAPATEILISRDDFIIHEISKAQADDLNKLTYKLFFISKAGIIDKKKRIYKAFTKEKKISQIVSKIYSQVSDASNISLNIEDEDTKVVLEKSFLSPGYTPFEAIDHLVKRTSYSGDYYMFFERLIKFREKTHIFAGMNFLTSHWKGINYVPNIMYQPQLSHVSSAGPNVLKAISVQLQDNFNHAGNMMMGFYNSRLRMIDPLTRRFVDAKLNYKDIQNQNKSPKILTDDNIFMTYDDSFPELPGERLMVRPRHDILANKNQWVRNDVFFNILMSTIRVNVDISGADNLISAGNYVKLTIPSLEAKQGDYTASVVPPDNIYSGEYFVTAVQHVFTIADYTKKLELSKDNGRLRLDNLLALSSNAPPPTNVEYIDRATTATTVIVTPAPVMPVTPPASVPRPAPNEERKSVPITRNTGKNGRSGMNYYEVER